MTPTTDEPGEFVNVHIECPLCSSSDAFCERADGSGKCFSCGENYFPEGLQRGNSGSLPSKAGSKRDSKVDPRLTAAIRETFQGASHQPLKSRRITLATCKHYDYRVRQLPSGEWEHLSPYYDKSGQLLDVHVRNIGKDGSEKKFYWLGPVLAKEINKGLPEDQHVKPVKVKDIGLFGSRTWEKGGKMFVITAGQIDTLTVSQAFGNNYSVASLPGGDVTAAAIAHHMEQIASFEKVVVWFDNDDKESSAEALAKAVEIVPPGKLHVVECNWKDANDMLVKGAADLKDISRLCWNAKQYRPDGLVDIRDLRSKLLEEPTRGISWGKNLEFLDEWTYGRKPGQNIWLGAGSGAGKTVILDQIIANCVLPPISEPCGVFSWERNAEEMGRAIIGKYAEKLFHIPQDPDAPDDVRDWTRNELVAAIDGFYEEAVALIINDSFGAADWDVVKERIRVMRHVDGVTTVVLDPITALTASLPESNQVQALDKMVANMALTTKELGITTIATSHLATPADGKSHEEGARVRGNQFRGSRAIMFWATGIFGFERNQQAEDPNERLIGTLRCLKDRFTGRATGKTKQLIYDTETGIYSPKDYGSIAPAIDVEAKDD